MTQRISFFIARIAIAAVAAVAIPSLALAQQGAPADNALSKPAAHQNPMPSAVASPSLAPPPMNAPGAQPDDALEVPSLKLRGQPGYQQVTVTVTDTSGKYVTDLKQDDFRVFEDGQERPVEFFRIDRQTPVSIGIVVDSSKSMESKMWQARTAITQFVNDLNRADDIFLESFSVQAELLQPFTFDHREIIDHLDFLHPLTQTALYDAVLMGLFEMQRGKRSKRALLVITDGMDNRSYSTRPQVIGVARRMKVLIYSIGIGDIAPKSKGFMGGILNPDSEEVDAQTLRDLSEATGARTFILRRVGDGEQLRQDCQAISNELRQQYTIVYLSPNPGRPGYRTLRVDVPKHPELSVRVRKGIAMP
jgi:Ca-activated chloride channel family protein